MLAVSQSGETKDVHRALVAAIKEGLPCLSVVNAVGSLIARTTQVGVYCHAGRENAVASTKAFTSHLALVAASFALFFAAAWLSRPSMRSPARSRPPARNVAEEGGPAWRPSESRDGINSSKN